MGTWIAKCLKYLVECIITLIYDEIDGCVLCGRDEEEWLLCPKCKEKIKECSIENAVKRDGINIRFYSSSYYSSHIKEMILRLKYKSDFKCGEALAELMYEVVKSKKLEFDIITFVPASKKGISKRGYNQSQFLARTLGKKTGKKVVNCLRKTAETRDQIGLDGEGRWNNLRNCFSVFNEELVKSRKILLVDDVITTGATAFYCGSELIKKGCKNVIILTAAKSKL